MTEGAAERCHGGDFTSVALLTYLFSDVKLNSSLKYMMLYMSLMGRSKRIVNHCFYLITNMAKQTTVPLRDAIQNTH